MARTPRLQVVLIVLVLCLSVSGAAYSQGAKGEIDGRVTDSSGPSSLAPSSSSHPAACAL